MKFTVVPKFPGARLLVDRNRPDAPGREWGNPSIELDASPNELRFIAFFDWYQFAPRDFTMYEVLIERLDAHPELVGRHGIIEVAGCSVLHEREPTVDRPTQG